MDSALIRACASGLRTKATSCRPAIRISATYWPRPRMKRSSSLRGRRAPTPCLRRQPRPKQKCVRRRTFGLPPPLQHSRRSGCHGLGKDGCNRVMAHAVAQTEHRLQQPFGDHLGLFVVPQDISAGLLGEHADIARSTPGLSAPIRSERPSISAGCDVTIGTTCSSESPSAIIELIACTRLNFAWPAKDDFRRRRAPRACRPGPAHACCSHGCRRRAWSERCRRHRLACETIGEVAAMADIDPQPAVKRCLDHRMNFALAIDEAAGMPRERMGQDVAGAEQRITRSRIVSTSSPLAPLSGRPHNCPKCT